MIKLVTFIINIIILKCLLLSTLQCSLFSGVDVLRSEVQLVQSVYLAKDIGGSDLELFNADGYIDY